MSERFNELLDRYWAAAYAQGRAGLDADDKTGSAQVAESNLCHYVDSLRTALATAHNDALDAANAHLTDQYGLSALGHPVDRARILSKLKTKETPNADTDK